jgi:hypothetical protein
MFEYTPSPTVFCMLTSALVPGNDADPLFDLETIRSLPTNQLVPNRQHNYWVTDSLLGKKIYVKFDHDPYTGLHCWIGNLELFPIQFTRFTVDVFQRHTLPEHSYAYEPQTEMKSNQFGLGKKSIVLKPGEEVKLLFYAAYRFQLDRDIGYLFCRFYAATDVARYYEEEEWKYRQYPPVEVPEKVEDPICIRLVDDDSSFVFSRRVLGTESGYFSELFSSLFQDSSMTEFTMEGWPASTLRCVLELLQGQRTDVPYFKTSEEYKDLAEIATYYHLPRLWNALHHEWTRIHKYDDRGGIEGLKALALIPHSKTVLPTFRERVLHDFRQDKWLVQREKEKGKEAKALLQSILSEEELFRIYWN